MKHDWSFLYDPTQFSFIQWLWIGAIIYGFVRLWLIEKGTDNND